MEIYFIRAGSTGPIKIGISNNVSERVLSLQTANHENLQLLYFEDMKEDAQEFEKIIHSYFKYLRKRGEWFYDKPFIIRFIKKCQEVGIKEALPDAWDSIKLYHQCYYEISDADAHIRQTARRYIQDGNIQAVRSIVKEIQETINDINEGRV
jgi:hypothetical protein